MAVGKEIRLKIKSFENTRKITKAMEMVAASKMRKAQDRMRAARPYSEKIRRLAANLSQANVTEYRHAFLSREKAAEVKLWRDGRGDDPKQAATIARAQPSCFDMPLWTRSCSASWWPIL